MNNSIKLLTKVLIIDNYDSFTYNLKHQLEVNNVSVEVRKNNEIEISDVEKYDKILLSPGPGLPSNAGVMPELIKRYYKTKPILGICLGHQAIGEAFGAKLKNLDKVLHGVALPVIFVDEQIFKNIDNPFIAGRYHSWVVDEAGFPEDLLITGRDEWGNIMVLKHKHLPIYGLQFHPESIMTPQGNQIITNWLKMD